MRRRPRTAAGPVIGRVYRHAYAWLCGSHPNLRPWHFQWLAGHMLYAEIRQALTPLNGAVLDVGCGTKPYRDWLPGATTYFGIDVEPGDDVDAVIVPGERWPVSTGSFDVVLCTQVLEHVVDLEHTVAELTRATRAGGHVVVSVPFIYSEHDAPHDYRRFSQHGVELLLQEHFEVVDLVRQGAVGSTIGVLLLNWMESTLTRGPTVLLLAAVLPLWIGFCGAVNAMGWILDRLDVTGRFYGNVLLVARRTYD